MKKHFYILRITLVLILIFALFASVTYAEPDGLTGPDTAADVGISKEAAFPDVADSSKPYYKPVYWAFERDYIRGYKDGNFGPQDNCTRAQFMTILWRMAGRPDPADESKEISFSDVSEQDSSYRAILWAAQKGIIKGYDDGTFRPAREISRTNVAVMLWRMQGSPRLASGWDPFSDVPADMTGVSAVNWGVAAGVIKGFSDGTFRPQDNCTRAQIVTMLYRFVRDVRHGSIKSSVDPDAAAKVPSDPIVSPLATSRHFSDHCDSRDGYAVRFIIIHHMAGRSTGEQCARYFCETEREVSANYCIGYDGDISCAVPEQYRSWSAGNRLIDKQAITIEVSDISSDEWIIPDAAQEALSRLIADIVSRYHEFGGVAVFDYSDESPVVNATQEFKATGAADYENAANGNILVHRWVSGTGTGCPEWHMMERLPYIAEAANAILQAAH